MGVSEPAGLGGLSGVGGTDEGVAGLGGLSGVDGTDGWVAGACIAGDGCETRREGSREVVASIDDVETGGWAGGA